VRLEPVRYGRLKRSRAVLDCRSVGAKRVALDGMHVGGAVRPALLTGGRAHNRVRISANVTADFGNVTGDFCNVTGRTGRQDWRCA
jgi:hypothetical protein